MSETIRIEPIIGNVIPFTDGKVEMYTREPNGGQFKHYIGERTLRLGDLKPVIRLTHYALLFEEGKDSLDKNETYHQLPFDTFAVVQRRKSAPNVRRIKIYMPQE